MLLLAAEAEAAHPNLASAPSWCPLSGQADTEDVRREVEILHLLTPHPTIAGLRAVFEDSHAVSWWRAALALALVWCGMHARRRQPCLQCPECRPGGKPPHAMPLCRCTWCLSGAAAENCSSALSRKRRAYLGGRSVRQRLLSLLSGGSLRCSQSKCLHPP